jgi:hypothetical protein
MSREGGHSRVARTVEAIAERMGRVKWSSVVGGSYMNAD